MTRRTLSKRPHLSFQVLRTHSLLYSKRKHSIQYLSLPPRPRSISGSGIFLRKRGEDRDVGETEILMNEGNIILHSDGLRFSTYCVCRSSMRDPSDPTLKRQERKRDEVACLPPRRCAAAYRVAVQGSPPSWAPIGRGEHGHITHAISRRMALHLFMQHPAGHYVWYTCGREKYQT